METISGIKTVLFTLLFTTILYAEWREVESDLAEKVAAEESQTLSLTFFSHDIAWAVCGKDPKVLQLYKTENGGSHWKPVITARTSGNPLNAQVVSFVNDTAGWVLKGDTLAHTTNGGQTWTNTVLPFSEVESIHFHTLLKGLAFTLRETWYTDNGGITWDTVPDTAGGGRIFGTFFTDTLHGWGLRSVVEMAEMYATSDGGKSWSRVAGIGMPGSIWVTDSLHIATAGNSGGFAGLPEIAVTIDGGSTWNRNTPSTYPTDVAFLDTLFGAVSCHDSSRFLQTVDGGKTWEIIEGIDGSGGNCVTAYDNTLYLLTYEGKIYRNTASTEATMPGIARHCANRATWYQHVVIGSQTGLKTRSTVNMSLSGRRLRGEVIPAGGIIIRKSGR